MRLLPALLLCLGAGFPAASISGSGSGSVSASTAGARTVPTPNPVAAVKDAEARRADAVARRDVDTLRRLIGRDYYHVETNGRVRSKTEFLQQVARDEYEFGSYVVDDIEVRLADGGRTAVVTGRQLARTRAGRPEQWRGRYLRIWVLHGDGWRNTLHQGTEIRSTALASNVTP